MNPVKQQRISIPHLTSEAKISFQPFNNGWKESEV